MNNQSTAMEVSLPDDDENSESANFESELLDAGQPETSASAVDPLSSDEPLSQSYGSEQIGLLVQSPEKLFLHWNHARDPHSTLRKALGEAASNYRLAVQLVDVESGEESLHDAPDEGTRWFDVKSGRTYRAEIGFVADGLPFIRVMSSAVVQTPRTGVSQIIDDSHEFQITAPDFASVLSEAGYAADARAIALEADDEQSTTPPPPVSKPLTPDKPPPSPSSFTMPRSARLGPL